MLGLFNNSKEKTLDKKILLERVLDFNYNESKVQGLLLYNMSSKNCTSKQRELYNTDLVKSINKQETYARRVKPILDNKLVEMKKYYSNFGISNEKKYMLIILSELEELKKLYYGLFPLMSLYYVNNCRDKSIIGNINEHYRKIDDLSGNLVRYLNVIVKDTKEGGVIFSILSFLSLSLGVFLSVSSFDNEFTELGNIVIPITMTSCFALFSFLFRDVKIKHLTYDKFKLMRDSFTDNLSN